jgi:hypothetical protein
MPDPPGPPGDMSVQSSLRAFLLGHCLCTGYQIESLTWDKYNTWRVRGGNLASESHKGD